MVSIKHIVFVLLFMMLSDIVFAQNDSIKLNAAGTVTESKGIEKITDSAAAKYNPRKAILRSAILPGWGQVTNKKIWKVPVVYAALGTTTYIFFRNLRQYREAKDAYILATDNDPSNDNQIRQPYFAVKDQPERIRTFRNEVRQNVDYSVLFFLVFWGLNVVDAAVDAHLKTFDVSDQLSLQLKPGYSPLANTNGLSFVLHIGK